MKIECLSLLVFLSCSSLSTSSSLQMRGFKSRNVLTALPHDVLATLPHDNVTGAEHQPGESNLDPETVEKEEENALWSGVSNINFKVTIMIAVVWVAMLGSAPVLIYKFGNKAVTNSALILSSLMYLALFGGLYLFTNIILFSSPHFRSVRSLSIIECTYFMTQVITTVGYGDITPAMPRGQVFVGLYVTLSFFVIALLMAEMQAVVMEKVNKYKEELYQKQGWETMGRRPSMLAITKKPERPPADSLLAAIGVFVSVQAVWVLFFHFFPGENKSWLEAVYMSLITLTTVGFGAVTPVTEGGMLFGAFFMFIGTSALLNVVQAFSTYILEHDQFESCAQSQHGEKVAKDLKYYVDKYNNKDETNISEEHFVIFNLWQKKAITEGDIDDMIAEIQEQRKRGKGGTLNMKQMAKQISPDIDRSQFGDYDTEPASSRPASQLPSAR